MSQWLDITYLKQLASRLEGFKIKKEFNGSFLANCRCPICGDSKKKVSKKRGNFYNHENDILYKCFNCNASMSFGTFLKGFDKNLYDRYALERYKNGQSHQHVKEPDWTVKNIPQTKKYTPDVTSSLKSIIELAESHPARKAIEKRKIPHEMYDKLFYAPKFWKWASGHTDKFKGYEKFTDPDHPRLIIPWYSQEGVLFKYSARAFGNEQPKYYHITLDETDAPFYGLDRIDFEKPIYVCEGQFDSMFVDNCIAIGNATIYNFTHSGSDVTYIPDSDVRNPDIMKIARKIISMGAKICMLPKNMNGKDINELVVNDSLTKDALMNIISNNTYKGLEAELQFTKWSRV